MSTTFLDIEHLQQLTYERSKSWATFLNNVAKNEDSREIALFDLEDVFGDEFDEQDDDDDLASMEDGECELSIDADVLRNITNTARLSILLNNKTMALPESTVGDVNDENHKLADVLNQTLPVINEHNRQLKESGFDRILNTFDKKKIEEKVGSWLNRHNSLYGGDATMICADTTAKLYPNSNCETYDEHKASYKTSKSYRNRHCKEDENNDSDDSLQSGETARYIRSSKASAMKNASSSTATIIKTYRTVKSKREALREKYACEQEDDETHLKAIRHRRRIAKEHEYHNHYEHAHSQRSYKYQKYTTPSKHNEKRKVLRKRTTSNSCSNFDNSSDSDNFYYEKDERNLRKKCPCCTLARNKYAPAPSHRSPTKMPSGRSNRIYYYSQCLSNSVSSSSSSSTSFTCERRRVMKSNSKFYKDKRPCRLESECRCCNERNLCQDYKHVADTSTEEWFVENCYSPKKKKKTTDSKAKPYKPTVAENLPPLNECEEDLPKRTTRHAAKETEIPKASRTKKNKQVSSTSTISNDTFDMELQIAIEASKKLYEEEQKIKTKETATATKDKRENKPTKPLRKMPRRNEHDLAVSEDEPTMRGTKTEHKRQTTESKAITEKTTTLNEHNEDATIVKDLCNEESLVKLTPTSTEETFFAPTQTQAICNSTAMTGDSLACKRQFADSLCHKDNSKRQEQDDDSVFNKDNGVITKSTNDTTIPITETKEHREIKSGTRKQTKCNRYKDDDLTDREDGQTLKYEMKPNRKRQTSKNTSVISTDDTIKEKIPKVVGHEKDSAIVSELCDDDIFVKPRPNLLKQPAKTSKKTKKSTVTSSEKTFLAPNHNQIICNSAAITNSTEAYKQQFADSLRNNENSNQQEQGEVGATHKQKGNYEKSINDTMPITETKEQRKKTAIPLKKLPRNKICKEDDLIDCEDEPTLKLEIKTNRKRQTTKNTSVISTDDTIKEKMPKVIEYENDNVSDSSDNASLAAKISKKTKNSTVTSSQETFYAPNRNQVICNSADMTNSTEACKRQFADSLRYNENSKRQEQDQVVATNKRKGNDEKSINYTIPETESKEQRETKTSVISKSNTIKEKNRKVIEHKNSDLSEEEFFFSNMSRKTKKSTVKSNGASQRKFSDSLCNRDETRNRNNDKTNESKKQHKTSAINDTEDIKTIKTQKSKSNKKFTTKSETTKKTATMATVTSTTTKRSPDTNSTKAQIIIKQEVLDLNSSSDEHSDCTLVTSTTNIEPPNSHRTLQPQTSTELSSSLTAIQQHRQHLTISSQPRNDTLSSNLHRHHSHTQKGILIYAPQNRSLVPADSFSNDGYFIITKEHLGSIIGEKAAEKFLKYYIGRRRFNSNSTIYFKPPSGVLDTNVSSSSESDDDLDNLGQYGDLYESFIKTPSTKSNKHS